MQSPMLKNPKNEEEAEERRQAALCHGSAGWQSGCCVPLWLAVLGVQEAKRDLNFKGGRGQAARGEGLGQRAKKPSNPRSAKTSAEEGRSNEEETLFSLPSMNDNSSHSSSSVTASGGLGLVLCDCGLIAPLKMTLIDFNPGRHFFGCAKWNEKFKQESCNFFLWYDPSTCPRGMEVGPMLTKKIKALESDKSDLEIKNKRLMKNIKALESEKLDLEITNKRLKIRMGLFWTAVVAINAFWVKTNLE
ncbi:hypothetical protein CJ030_MR2G013763 [Morella rubra]|uniref:GRF-type domain-containing protein n=1 Tax=Morella rubra TaxID=262757 RepID=A0A6A1WG71_9ROSI|nr:hypothetical protein CJ030_MR2G013763 [Morella rubra]